MKKILSVLTLITLFSVGIVPIDAVSGYDGYYEGEQYNSYCDNGYQKSPWAVGETGFEVRNGYIVGVPGLLEDAPIVGGKAVVHFTDDSTFFFEWVLYFTKDSEGRVTAEGVSKAWSPAPPAKTIVYCQGEMQVGRTTIYYDDGGGSINGDETTSPLPIILAIGAPLLLVVIFAAASASNSAAAASASGTLTAKGSSSSESSSEESVEAEGEGEVVEETIEEHEVEEEPEEGSEADEDSSKKSKSKNKKGRQWREVHGKKIVNPKPGMKAPGGKTIPPKYGGK